MPVVRTLLVLICAGAILLVGVGCYKTQYPLGSVAGATVNPDYVGDYTLTENNKVSTFTIRNIDNHIYYVEWRDSDEKSPNRMVGYTADVNGVTFANLRELTVDGSTESDFLIMRISLSPDHAKLTLRNLKDDFFKDKTVDSSAALHDVIAANLDNDKMYDGDPAVLTRVAPATQPAQ